MSEVLNNFEGFNPEEHRYKLLEIPPWLFGDFLLNAWITPDSKVIQAIKVEGLPADVRIQAIRFDSMRHVVRMRLWSSEWPIVPLAQEAERIDVVLTEYRYTIVEPAESPLSPFGKVKLEEKRGYEFL
jgi:hypothetical protein